MKANYNYCLFMGKKTRRLRKLAEMASKSGKEFGS